MFTHHAQLIEGDENALKNILKKIQEKLGISEQHPDLRTFSFSLEKLGVDDAHLIRDAILSNPVEAPYRVVAIYASQITEQAQNALLKITEEPPVHSRIFLVTPFIPHLLPTLRSRFVIFNIDNSENENSVKDSGNNLGKSSVNLQKNFITSSEEFLKMSIDKRLGVVKDIHAGMDKEEVGISEVWQFANDIERKVQEYLKESSKSSKSSEPLNSEEKINILETLLTVQKYIHAPGNSVKMLLEYMAVSVPKTE